MGSQRQFSQIDFALLQEQAAREARASFWAYRQHLNPDMLKGWWQRDAGKHLEQWYRDLCSGLRPTLVIEAPPQHGKSRMIVEFLSWVAGQNADLATIYTSVSDRLGIRANLMLQRIFDGEKYHRVFPGTRINDSNVVTQASKKQRNREILEYLNAHGSFRNTTVNGSIVGEGLDIGVIDDPIKGREAANSATIRDKTWDWLNDDFFTRFSDHAGLLIILTRWHLDDPVGRLIKADSKIKVIRYPALAEPDAKLMPTDPRKPGSGVALFPEHKSREFILERKGRMRPDSFESLYQQNPFVIGGDIFRALWWQYWRDFLPKMAWRAIYADTAQKDKEQHDYAVFQCWGKTTDGRAALIDQIRGKWESPDLEVQARAFWNKHNEVKGLGVLRALKIEDKVSGTGLIQSLKKPRDKKPAIPVVGIPRSRDKIERAKDVTPAISAGLVLLPEDAPWLSDYLLEFSQFPNGKHDDQVDPTIDAIVDILGGTSYSLENVR